ncbi:modifier of mdg4-like isoform X11 [Phlebotomus argentipes]|uniref:modifier of mdg4-like isoform X11 n=1 Tax=Phlebotomus argentipes TaxID=94469 RepID=UPI002892DE21|nr:modifier of mdg4-like isoform X11 [Phlebotomus argentipes]XP_059611353.1 modifier of mdg4-like isoform X11 [Phlebotomus argentipes]
MADEELFSLCWNNFNTNLSAGFHESLVNGDLVDVTLAAEGQLVKAHRLVLSVCSPYFRKMFTNMPANQHAFVFLKDVTHSALKELIQFMYCGEVNVKQEALPAFISTAEALQIKGLTDSGDTAPPPSSPTKVATPSHSSASSPSRVRTQQRTVTRTTYKMESEDSADERQMIQVHTQKRSAPRQTIALQSIPSSKRSKIETIETVEQAADTSATTRISEKSDAEFIDLPITETLSAKAEPVEEYAEDTAEDIEQEGEATYVEEDTYGDMKYDESYFTENDESNAKANVSGFGESYAEGDQSVAEAQGLDLIPLHSGSSVYVSKKDLITIFTNKPHVYTSRLADLLFGREALLACKEKYTINLSQLDPVKLKSLIIHIVQVCKRSSMDMNEQSVLTYLKTKINNMSLKKDVI